QTFYSAVLITSAIMVLLTILAQLCGGLFIRGFSKDPSVIAFGGDYLQIISLNFVAMGIVFTSSSVFQGIGNTLPPLLSSATRLVLFVIPATILASRPDFYIKQVWYLSVVSILCQTGVNLLLLRREFRRKLAFDELATVTGSPTPA
ncbi:MAG TPA: MATE family efflux transporter, partial [Chthoniobacterales bacterium]